MPELARHATRTRKARLTGALLLLRAGFAISRSSPSFLGGPHAITVSGKKGWDAEDYFDRGDVIWISVDG
jgi:hypothetical protein